MIDLSPQYVSRVFVLPVSAFDYLKRYQRALSARAGKHHDNSQVITQLLLEHEQFVGLTGKPSISPKTALLMPNTARNKEGQE